MDKKGAFSHKPMYKKGVSSGRFRSNLCIKIECNNEFFVR